VAWPTVSELRSALGVTTVSVAIDAVLARALGAAIEQVGTDCGYSGVAVSEDSDEAGSFELTGYLELDDEDEPDTVTVTPNYSMEQAALLLATTITKAPDAPFGVAAVFDAGGIYVARSNPNYVRLLVGNRQHFGVG